MADLKYDPMTPALPYHPSTQPDRQMDPVVNAKNNAAAGEMAARITGGAMEKKGAAMLKERARIADYDQKVRAKRAKDDNARRGL